MYGKTMVDLHFVDALCLHIKALTVCDSFPKEAFLLMIKIDAYGN